MIIHIKNVKLKAIIGVNEWEREKKQEILLNVKITFDGDKAAKSDRIHDTIDYEALMMKVLHTVEKKQFYLVETLVDYIGETICEDKRAISVEVEIDKPKALPFADSVSITKTFERDS